MARARKTTDKPARSKRPIEQYDHKGQQRRNNPPVGLVTEATDRDAAKKTYAYDPHLDPTLTWAGKAEHTSFQVPTVSLHVHERIDPKTIIEAVRRRNGMPIAVQGSLFESAAENPPLREAIDFYQHAHAWSNRLIAGDSLLVMNSLLEKEGMAGKVQMVYIDPPYGISYGQLIINGPYDEPTTHWRYERESRTFTQEPGRRPAGYIVATPGSKSFDDPGVFHELPLVNRIRPRVNAWREAGYPGVTGTTRRLLEHWRDPENFEGRRFFFCQMEAVETLIWLTEGPAGERQGLDVAGGGGPFPRLCAKMATGSGKTLVMAMVIAWHILNRVANPQDGRFSKHVFVVAPGLTVKNRLAVLEPSHQANYYDAFDMVPSALRERLRQGRVLVRNWHVLNWESDEQLARRRGVDKRGAKSDVAYVHEVLGEMASASNLLVINDEAHHAWRVPAGSKIRGVAKADIEEATRWIGGLDRIHRSRGILGCYDFSATPFAPSGRESTEEALFSWIVSDFSLNDAIESGLVKTPRVVVRDDGVPHAATYRSKLYHIYHHVRDDLSRKAEAHEPLPDLVVNGYYLLGKDWLETARRWAGLPTPPVMITVANRVETAARVYHAFVTGKVHIDELAVPDRTLHIDSKVLEKAEAREDDEPIDQIDTDDDTGNDEERPARKLTRQEQAERLRVQVDTVGQPGKPGEPIQNVISVGMLTEGWDARTVTHIMGLRAFSIQLLCEQVVGRGLRRTSYELAPNGRFPAEHVNIFASPSRSCRTKAARTCCHPRPRRSRASSRSPRSADSRSRGRT